MTRQPDQKTEEAIAADGTFATMLRRPGLADDEASGGRSSALRQRGHVLLVALFVIYLVLLAWTVVWKLDVPYVGEAALLSRPIKLIPFVPTAEAGASAPLEVVANIVLFIPFGLYLGLLAPGWPWWKAVGVFVGASLVLETAQHVLSTGSFDTTDVIVNAAGGLAGVGLLALARRTLQTRTVVVMARVCLVGTVVTLFAIGIFVASPLHYGPQRDVIFPRPLVDDWPGTTP